MEIVWPFFVRFRPPPGTARRPNVAGFPGYAWAAPRPRGRPKKGRKRPNTKSQKSQKSKNVLGFWSLLIKPEGTTGQRHFQTQPASDKKLALLFSIGALGSPHCTQLADSKHRWWSRCYTTQRTDIRMRRSFLLHSGKDGSHQCKVQRHERHGAPSVHGERTGCDWCKG